MTTFPELDSIRTALCGFIRENLVAPGVGVQPETPLDVLGLDSFSIIEIVLFIERNYQLSLPDEALNKENLYSAASIAECVRLYLERTT